MQIVKVQYADGKFSLIRVNHPTELEDYKDLDYVGTTNLNGQKIKEYKHKSYKR
jgi:hypothetical protein